MCCKYQSTLHQLIRLVLSPKIPGERIMGELVQANIVLLPLAIDPLGKWGPMMDRFLFGADARAEFSIPSSHPNAAAMLGERVPRPALQGS